MQRFFRRYSKCTEWWTNWYHKYNSSKRDYHPPNDAGWKKGGKVPYMALARTLELVRTCCCS